jgi:hypothetical protein
VTDYYGQVVEVETSDGAPTLEITDDRADVLWLALQKLGYPPFDKSGSLSWANTPEVVKGATDTDPARVKITFPPNTDADELQDLLDELDYRPDGTIVRVIT